jgi:hypothetical protein
LGIGNRQCDLKDNPTKNIQAAPPLHTPSHLQASTFRVQQDTQVLKKLLDKLTTCTHSGIVNAGKHMASFFALKTTSKKWKDAAQKTGTKCFAYARAFVVLIVARIAGRRNGCIPVREYGQSAPVRELVFVIYIVKNLYCSKSVRFKKQIRAIRDRMPLPFLLPDA